ncbi:nucleotidyltransferase [Tissierella pigra]|uniref:tRNA(Met) cytidine acetate ligase n=1 Tax=Tissierella pigra TaxID=2607614 RepID=A0A6N7XQP1_9FIRM|nr:nucleotidyltransferase [Tissierella pigra]MBU5426497.1 nucleotidyltransferase [Tissierella pigra]MSU00057.1 nucleotidyltransferase [Tissierella pigra]
MTVVGFITEYNPFHFGHKYHLEESMGKAKADYSIAIMSGSFLQRGEPSFIDKWTKAKMAVDNGVDLVLELPFIFSTQSAELFAYGGIKLLDSLNIVDYISFGSEIGDLEPLNTLASILAVEPDFYKEILRYNLSLGLSYSVSRSNALNNYINKYHINNTYNYQEILNRSNNILGIEYLKSLINLNSKIKPVTIKRSGKDYNDLNLSNDFASATGIRNSIINNGLPSIKNLVPFETYYHLEEYLQKYHKFNLLENYNQILLYLIRTIEIEKLKSLLDIEPGLENRIVNYGNKNNNIKEIINSIVTKRYPRTRIQRLFIHLLNQLDKKTFWELYNIYPSYVRVLGAGKNGLTLINKIKKNSSLPIITKFADYKHFKDNSLEKILMFDKRATDIFFMGLESSIVLSNMDYYNSPYIK